MVKGRGVKNPILKLTLYKEVGNEYKKNNIIPSINGTLRRKFFLMLIATKNTIKSIAIINDGWFIKNKSVIKKALKIIEKSFLLKTGLG